MAIFVRSGESEDDARKRLEEVYAATEADAHQRLDGVAAALRRAGIQAAVGHSGGGLWGLYLSPAPGYEIYASNQADLTWGADITEMPVIRDGAGQVVKDDRGNPTRDWFSGEHGEDSGISRDAAPAIVAEWLKDLFARVQRGELPEHRVGGSTEREF